jgi:hypothetical protein
MVRRPTGTASPSNFRRNVPGVDPAPRKVLNWRAAIGRYGHGIRTSSVFRGGPPRPGRRRRRRTLRLTLVAVAAWIALLVAASAPAEIYTWTDESGKTHYSNNPGQVPADVWQEKNSPGVPISAGPSRVRISYRRYRLPDGASDAVRKLLQERNTESAVFALGPYLLTISGSGER